MLTINSSDDNSSLFGSENESDYDNNYSMIAKIPVNHRLKPNELTRTDDLILSDQNEIILNNDTHIENLNVDNDHQSDIAKITSHDASHDSTIIRPINTAGTALNDSAPSDIVACHKDSITARRLLDIRSHLLLNTTLDAT